jgi:phosphohistidine phosphatase
MAAMHRLMLLRPAKAEPGQPGAHDRDRALTPRGRADAARVGAYMARHALVPDLALVSPANRTRETWALIASAFAPPPRAAFDERLYQADAGHLLTLIRETGEVRSLAIVGHNPGLHELAMQLIAAGDVEARQRISEGLPTAALAMIELAFDHWPQLRAQAGRLERFVSPRVLAAATD